MAKLKPEEKEYKQDDPRSEGPPKNWQPAAAEQTEARHDDPTKPGDSQPAASRGGMGLDGMGLDGGARQADPPPAAAAPPELARQNAVVICPYCKTQCRAGKTEAFFTRYYCPSEGCSFSHKVPRPRMDDRIAAAQAAEQDYSAR